VLILSSIVKNKNLLYVESTISHFQKDFESWLKLIAVILDRILFDTFFITLTTYKVSLILTIKGTVMDK